MISKQDAPLMAFGAALLLLPYPMMKLAPFLSMHPASPESNETGLPGRVWSSRPAAAGETDWELVPGEMTLGDLAEIADASNSDPVAKEFWDACMERPDFGEEWDEYRRAKDARRFSQFFMRRPEFRDLFARFHQREDFRLLL